MMTNSNRPGWAAPGVAALALALVMALLAPGCGEGETPGASDDTPKIDGKAAEVLKGMTDKISAAQQITIRGSQSTDAELLGELDKPELAQLFVSLKRPNRFIAGTTSEARDRRMFYDGETFSLVDVGKNFFASVPMSGDFDQVVDRLEDRFGFGPPVAELLMADPYEYLLRDVNSVSYVGEETVGDILCHHLLAVEELIRWDVWVTVDGLEPLEIVATATSFEDEPKITIKISEIDTSSGMDDGLFIFEPPPGATKIRMLPLDEIYED